MRQENMLMQHITDFFQFTISDFFIYLLYYFPIAGGFYFLFWKKGKVQKYFKRIQLKIRSTPQKRKREIMFSMLTFAIFATIDFGLYVLANHGYTKLYTTISDYGWWYIFVSLAGMLIIHDTYFYWSHRLMHHPFVFKHVHKIHHESIDTNPFTSFSFHPIEAVFEAGIYILVAFLFPVHLLTLYLFHFIMTTLNVIGHLGYEIYPKNWVNNKWLHWKTPSTHHNMHHSRFNGNYGLYFTFWDKIMKTEFPDYEQTFNNLFKSDKK